MSSTPITRNNVFRVFPGAARSKRVLEAAVLDIAFDVLLQEMHRQGLFEEFNVVLKGGTALRKLRFGHKGRFSFDLDFDVEPGCETIIADTIDGFVSTSFVFEVNDRRGHQHISVTSDLLPNSNINVKLDFSQRGIWLESERLSLATSPILHPEMWDTQTFIPTMRLEENIAEKLSRWQTRRLVRDLYDIAAAWQLIHNIELVAELYVLKSHRNWSAMLASRRPSQAALPLTETTIATQPNEFNLEDFVHPTLHTTTAKLNKIKKDLQVITTAAQRIDQHIANSPLQAIANDTGQLVWKTTQHIETLQHTWHRPNSSDQHNQRENQTSPSSEINLQ